MKTTMQIFKTKKNLSGMSFMGSKLATLEDYKTVDKTLTFFKFLKPFDVIELKKGVFTLDNNLDLIDDNTDQVYSIAKGIYEDMI